MTQPVTILPRDVVFASGVRTAIGDYGGSLKDFTPSALGAMVGREAIRRAGIAAGTVGQAVFGNVIHTEARDMYVSRVAALEAGVPKESPALTVNRLCGSGMQAIVSAAQAIALGDCDVALAGGCESMSRAGYLLPTARWGARMGDTSAIDMMVGALTDPCGTGHMGITAEILAEKYGIDRATQDAFAVESHRRAAAAIAAGHFRDQIMPVVLKTRKGETVFDTDEHVRPDIDLPSLTKLRAAFRKDGTVTAGNASGINDGAAAVILMAADSAAAAGVTPMARLTGYAHAGVEPSEMGYGPVPAVQALLARTGLTIADFDVIESNEAFAAQACAVAGGLSLPADRTNPNGGAIALGHPIGASGAIIVVKALYELERIKGRRALCTMCIGGGQGIAVAIERLG